jgi:hypothetical protein
VTANQILLTVNQRAKAIPYPPATNSGYQNFGFRVLKGKLDKIANVQEAKDIACLQEILGVLNDDASPFFSVGCEKSFNVRSTGHWAKGYIEFAYNYKEPVSDARHYFPLFFQFTKSTAEYVEHHDVQYWWDLQPASFEAINCAGFSCCIWITTGMFAQAESARTEWEAAVRKLSDFLRSVKIPTGKITQIY